MKRSNRLMLVLGVLLALLAFGGVLLFGSGSGNSAPAAPQTVAVVTAAVDVSLGTALDATQLATVQLPVADATDTYRDPAQIIGQVVRRTIHSGAAFTSADFQSSAGAAPQVTSELKPGQVAMAVGVDQLSGVGSLIQPGDYVDVILAVTDTDLKNPVTAQGPTAQGPAASPDPFNGVVKIPDEMLNNTSVKVVVQNVQVLGTLGGAATAAAAQGTESATVGAAVAPTNTMIVLSVTPQQAEIVRFTQLDGNLFLVLRSPGDASAADTATTGVTLRELVDDHGVLPPRIILSQVP